MNKALYCKSALFILCCAPLGAKEQAEKLPSIAFLEYLAEMKEVDGEYYGPQDMKVELCKVSVSKREKQPNESRKAINGEQDDQEQKNDKTAKESECKHHD